MKKILLLYILISIFVYGDFLSTNGEVSFSYDNNLNGLKTLKGDVYDVPSISQIEIGIMFGKDVYPLKDHITDVKLLADTNILFLKSKIEGVRLNTYIFPSSEEKSRIYIINEFLNPPDGRDIQVIYKLNPYIDTGIVRHNSPKGYYAFEKTRFKSLNNSSGLYISKDEYIDVFKFREVKEEDIKYQEDKLFFVTKVVDRKNKNYDMVAIDFSKNEWPNKVILNTEVLKKEYLLWREWNWDFKKYPEDIRAQLTHLKMLTMGEKMPAVVYYGRSVDKLSTRLNIATILSIYGKFQDSRLLLKDYKFKRKNSSKDVAVLLSLFKSWEFSREPFDNKIFLTKVYPIIMRTLKGIDSTGKFNGGDEDIEVYYNLIMLIEELILNPLEIKDIPKKILIEKLEKLKKYVEINFITQKGIKDTPKSDYINPRNIRFIELYPENYKKIFIEEEFKKYYDRRLGYMVLEETKLMDLEYNLYFAQILYNNSFKTQGERLYRRIREVVEKNNNYSAPEMYMNRENEIGIYGNLIYLYLLTNYYRGIE